MNKSLNMVRSLSLAVLLLSTTIVSAMDAPRVNVIDDRGMVNIYGGENENVMRDIRQQACKRSGERLVAIMEAAGIPETYEEEMVDIGWWLHNQNRNNPLFQRHIPNTNTVYNYVDDAIAEFERIRNSEALNFAHTIYGKRYSMRQMLAWVWAAIKYYGEITGKREGVERDQENMLLTLLKRGLAENIEDDRHGVCNVGVSSRILHCLQGYYDGIALDGDIELTNSGATQKDTPDIFVEKFETKLAEYANSLSEDHPLTLAASDEPLPSNVSPEEVINLLDRAAQSWIDAAHANFPPDSLELKVTLDGIEKILRGYRGLINSAAQAQQDSDSEAEAPQIFRGDINQNLERAKYENSTPHRGTRDASSSSTTVTQSVAQAFQPRSSFSVPSVSVSAGPDIFSQLYTRLAPLVPAVAPQPRAAAAQIAQPRVGEIKTENGWLWRFNGEDWSRLRRAD
ncbi:hypothetical protein [Candidatus Odyssella thessalonicensis]|uniref:hypothetical protein n=1 Tax=Candidatus Odyssella thessalonicensis TaxID=84647 RepID=UPI0002E8C5D5|nr:hypothetical protein [Candidatus Odyssella thessalonicensis]